LAIEGADRDLDSQLDAIEFADESRGSKRFLASLSKHRGEAAPVLGAAEVVFDFVPRPIDAL
jgi:hypothetical protein